MRGVTWARPESNTSRPTGEHRLRVLTTVPAFINASTTWPSARSATGATTFISVAARVMWQA